MAQSSPAEKKGDSAAADILSELRKTAADQENQGPPCSAKVEHGLDLPAGGLLTRVEVEVLALAAGECALNEAGEVRSSPDDTIKAVIDLKSMRSVSGLDTPLAISEIVPWTGAGFASEGPSFTSGKKVRFAELATEKLLVTFESAVDIEELAGKGKILLPDAPSDLVLSLNGKTAWTHIGQVKLNASTEQAAEGRVHLDAKAKEALINRLLDLFTAPSAHSGDEKALDRLLAEYGITLTEKEKADLAKALSSNGRLRKELTAKGVETWLASLGVTWENGTTLSAPSFRQTVDLTQMLQDEINGGASTVTLELRAALACRLQLTVPTLDYLCGYDVDFPAQALTLEIDRECASTLSLPLPDGSNGWLVRQTTFTLSGNIPKSRFFPATGPQAIDLGELLLDNDHGLAALLTKDMLARFGKLEGIRLPLVVSEGGAEITAFIRGDDNGKVGDSLTEAVFRSQTVEEDAQEQWLLLALDTPMDIPADTDLWVEVRVIRGSCWWQLGGNDGETEGVVSLQRGVPGGTFSPLSLTLNSQVHHFRGRLRLQGQPVTDGAIAAVRFFDPHSQEELKGLTPGNGPIEVRLEFSNGVHPSGGQLNIPVLFHAPGTYTVTKARVIYEE
ncbi:MAG: hypothetical protein AB7E77_09010 [Desulfobulbus sp.]